MSKNASSCGTIPIFDLVSLSKDLPNNLISPFWYFINPKIEFINVVLPLPFGPSIPSISPSFMSKDTSSRAIDFSLYFFVKIFYFNYHKYISFLNKLYIIIV